ncbi:heterokaryon incompatibility protein-domain-containing protein [Calycina marina]|uniref:Heterokaryon incompatibility protein-domain-containing protein n=1 Tax=Calycina marina TaxID=1763456 RepID=A0A9P7ZAX5_9HELO|nr:heterokaryon incompatibility protein-domain-containing protein [Calycina marina]
MSHTYTQSSVLGEINNSYLPGMYHSSFQPSSSFVEKFRACKDSWIKTHGLKELDLVTGEEADRLECRLSVASLEAIQSYEALSYCWGQNSSGILVDGHDFIIPKNLEEALRKMRFQDKERILWADAICIDQSQVVERNTQVALMADIYRKCDRCLVWLGATNEFDRDTNEMFGSLPELLTALSKKRHLNQPGPPRISPMFGFTNIGLMLLNAVIQEVILSPQSQVLFGSMDMHFSDIVKAVEFIDEHDIGSTFTNDCGIDDLCHCMDRIKLTFIWTELLTLRNRVYQLLKVAPDKHQIEEEQVMAVGKSQQDSHGIVDVLLGVRHRNSTDPRDKFFGALLLVESNGENGSPFKPTTPRMR